MPVRISLILAILILISACSTGPAYVQPASGETATIDFSVKFNNGSYTVFIHECPEMSCNYNSTKIIAALETGFVKHVKPKKGQEYPKAFSEKQSATVKIPTNRKFIFSIFAKSVIDSCSFNAYIEAEANKTYKIILETESTRCSLRSYEVDANGQPIISNKLVIYR
jgi:hypothetical protein